MRSSRIWMAAVLMGASAAAQAHYLWIERDGAAAKVYFGEWAADLRENDNGPMKAIQGLKAYGDDGTGVEIVRKQDHFLLPSPPKGDLRLFDEVMHRSAKVVYDIKYGRSGTKAVASFELVPEAANSNVLMLVLDGKPLPKTEVVLYGPPKWQKHYTTDDAGRITIETPWAGYYLLRAQSDDESGGEFEGKKFDRIINVAILSFNVDKGIAWPAK